MKYKRNIFFIFFLIGLFFNITIVSGEKVEQAHSWKVEDILKSQWFNDNLRAIYDCINDIEDDNISNSAGLNYSKLSLTGVILNSDISVGAGIWGSKIDFTSGTLVSSLIFEGSRVDAYETTLFMTDPTADRTITFSNRTGTILLETDIQNRSLEGSSPLVFEGATEDEHELTISITNPSAANTITLNAVTGIILTDEDIQNQVLLGEYPLTFEGAEEDDYEAKFKIEALSEDKNVRVIKTSGTVLIGSDNDAGEQVTAFIYFKGESTVEINKQFGVSSLVDNGSGDYTINWNASVFANNHYAASITSSQHYNRYSTHTTSALRVLTYERSLGTNESGFLADSEYVNVICAGEIP